MNFSIEFKNAAEEIASEIPIKELISAAETISERYRSEKADGSPLINSEAEAAAYGIVRMPATIGAAGVAMSCAAESFRGEINTMLDVGAGTGACCWAAAEIFDDLTEIICLEREKNMVDFGKKLMKSSDFPIECQWLEKDVTKDFSLKADLVTASYLLNEMPDDKRRRLTERLWNAAEKMLIIIEPGTPKGFANIKAIRAQLIGLGAKIAAPCPHKNECLTPENDWCHFTARISRTKLHKQLKNGDAPYEDEKFCYIAAVRDNAVPCTARILRHPKTESGKITLKLCTADNITEKIITKKDGTLFKKARKSNCGDSFG